MVTARKFIKLEPQSFELQNPFNIVFNNFCSIPWIYSGKSLESGKDQRFVPL